LSWQEKFNLVAKSTLPLIWTRHISDSLQLIDHAPDAKVWADYGSGAGFPGIPDCLRARRQTRRPDPSH